MTRPNDQPPASADERRARELLTDDVWLSLPAYLQPAIVRAMLAFADADRRLERESCAAVADDARCKVIGIPSASQDMAAKAIATAIRARGENA